MKKVIYIPFLAMIIALVFVSCTSRKKDINADTIATPDTLGLAEFQRFKLEAEIREKIEAENALKSEGMATVAPAPVVAKHSSAARSTSSRRGATYRSNKNHRSSGTSGYSSPSRNTNTTASAPVQQKRRGMSHTAKGAIVGAASGAVIGAVANKKNRLGGGVVGGVIGAATGAGVGAIVDKKERQRNGY